MTQNKEFVISTARSSFIEMLKQAESLQAQILMEARSSLGYQYAERLSMEARTAIKTLDLQEKELSQPIKQ